MSHVISGATHSDTQRTGSSLQDVTNTPKVIETHGSSVLPGMTISGNNTVNIYFHQILSQGQSATYSVTPPTKKPRCTLIDSSDEEA